ncbi:MAG: transposase, partial [Candidatus Omnitrophica bacterium]|nr:transposase [Candidatus Omnitrophota bacterium]
MAKYKNYSYEQLMFIPVNFSKQIIPGSFEYALSYIVDKEIDVTIFETRYKNDETGAPAYDPAILLKIVLYAYSRGITSSRQIENFCRENVIFMALSADTKPHFTTIAEFISSMKEEITPLFRDILLYCEELQLIDKGMFAIDGCKITSDASKEWSGTREDYEKKIEKLEKTIHYILDKHQSEDQNEDKEVKKDETEHIENIQKKITKIKQFLKEHNDKKGARGNIKKSNITDNESAKMPSSQGVIQGYNGVAMAEAKHQIIVHAEAFGQGPEKSLLEPMLEGAKESFKAIGEKEDVLKKSKLITDTGFYTKDNIQLVETEKIDAYIPDNKFRQRDPRFATAKRHNKPIDGKKTVKKRKYFVVEDFSYDKQKKTLICPAGKEMYIKNRNYEYKGSKAIAYMCRRNDARACPLRYKCIRNPKAEGRQVHIFYER